ncbi:MAG: ATP synthase F1 subunit delta, partial [Flavobacterium sp.]|nr:ATP synthase F1 subunit delta [Flavobacterium sp.]
MASTRAAIRYAKAILEIAQAKGAADAVNADMLVVEETMSNNAELRTFIGNPTTKVEVKESVLLEVFGNTHAVTKSLFHLLFENKRFELLHAIAVEYTKLHAILNGVETAQVTTA